jgi:arginine/ornithine N-succinyltransferase beta subunit
MREYVLTDTERKILESYLRKNIKLQDFRIVMFRIRKAHEQLKSDMNLIDAVLQKSKS